MGALISKVNNPERTSHLGTLTRYPRRVAKPKYEPPNDETAARIARTVDLYRRLAEIEAEYKASLAVNADPDGDAVPIAYLAERLGVERKTVYRHLGRPMK